MPGDSASATPPHSSGGWRHELHPRRLAACVTAGVVDGILTVVLSISFAALIFIGPLAEHVPAGIGVVLLSAAIVALVVGWKSSIPGTIACPQESAAAILALVAASLVQGASDPDVAYHTVVAAVVASSLATGVFFLLLGVLHLGDMIRFVPYPVVGGFLAGTGWLLVQGSFVVMADDLLTLAALPKLMQASAVARWLPGLAFGVALLLVLRRSDHSMVTPAMLVGGFALFHGVLWISGTPLERAIAAGFLPEPLSTDGLWRAPDWAGLARADWGAVLGQAGSLATILVVSATSILINVSALGLTLRRDADLNRELEVAGVANLLCGAVGGVIGYQTLSDSVLAHKMGADGRSVGVVIAALCLATLFFGGEVIALFPKALLGGLLLYLGLEFLVAWIVDAWRKLPRADYFIVVLILFVIATFGFMQGIAVGVVAGFVLFIVNYSRVDVIKHELSGANYQSNVDRSPDQRALLREQGSRIHILRLHGYIFFWNANYLLEHVRARADDRAKPPLAYVVFDFRQVSGLDSSAVLSFGRLRQMAEKTGMTLVFVQPPARIRAQLAKGGFEGEEGEAFRVFADLDYGVEWCENELLAREGLSLTRARASLAEQLAQAFPDTVDVELLLRELERLEVDAGYYLMRQNDAPEDLFFIESGRVTVQLELGDGKTFRLRKMGAGTIVGEMGIYLGNPRSASVVTDEPSTLYRLTASALRRIERESPEVATAFHQFIVRLLAERLMSTNKTLKAVLD